MKRHFGGKMPLINTPEVTTHDIGWWMMTRRIATKLTGAHVCQRKRKGPRDTIDRIRIQKNLAHFRWQQKPFVVKSETRVELFTQL